MEAVLPRVRRRRRRPPSRWTLWLLFVAVTNVAAGLWGLGSYCLDLSTSPLVLGLGGADLGAAWIVGRMAWECWKRDQAGG